MFRLIFTSMFWISVFSESSRDGFSDLETFFEKKKRITPRGYYGGLAYPYLPFAEPLTILAGLAFLAYIIQVFHSMYHHHNGLGGLGGLGGGLLNNVLPPKSRNLFPKARKRDKIIKLID